jgi:hypothetical protein
MVSSIDRGVIGKTMVLVFLHPVMEDFVAIARVWEYFPVG